MSSSSAEFVYVQNPVKLDKPAPVLENQPVIVAVQENTGTNQELAVAEQMFGLLCWTFWAGEPEVHRPIADDEDDEEDESDQDKLI